MAPNTFHEKFQSQYPVKKEETEFIVTNCFLLSKYILKSLGGIPLIP